MKKSTAKKFFNDVTNALSSYFEDRFWSIDTEILHHEATIYIKVHYDQVPEYIDDVFIEVENAMNNLHWEYGADWDGNTYFMTIEEL